MVRADLVDAQGQPVAGSVEERVIARQVPLDLSREISDTRIPPGGRFTLDYSRRLEAAGLKLCVTVTVLPDEFYTRFFEALLAGERAKAKRKSGKRSRPRAARPIRSTPRSCR